MLCDLIWHVIFCSSDVISINCYIRFTYFNLSARPSSWRSAHALLNLLIQPSMCSPSAGGWWLLKTTQPRYKSVRWCLINMSPTCHQWNSTESTVSRNSSVNGLFCSSKAIGFDEQHADADVQLQCQRINHWSFTHPVSLLCEQFCNLWLFFLKYCSLVCIMFIVHMCDCHM